MSRQRKEPLSWQEEPPQASQGDRAASSERGRDDNAQCSHGSVWTPLPRCKLLTSHCVLAWWKEGALWDPFNQGTSLPFVGGGPPDPVASQHRHIAGQGFNTGSGWTRTFSLSPVETVECSSRGCWGWDQGLGPLVGEARGQPPGEPLENLLR